MNRLIITLLTLLSIFTLISKDAFAQHKAQAKKGILLVTFGTSHPEARVAFHTIEKQVKAEFPGLEVQWAFTSKIIRKILEKRGEHIDSPTEALAKMGENGFTHVAVQSLHVIPGEEYHNLKHTVEAFNKMPKGIQICTLGTPLLFSDADNKKVASFIHAEYKEKTGTQSAVVLMGHGTHHPSNIYYPGFQYYLRQKSNNYYLGTVEGFPALEQVIHQLKTNAIEQVTLVPFMSVAGDHAKNDMAGDEPDSWKSVLEKEGFKVETILKGLAEHKPVVEVWVEHLKVAFNEL